MLKKLMLAALALAVLRRTRVRPDSRAQESADSERRRSPGAAVHSLHDFRRRERLD